MKNGYKCQECNAVFKYKWLVKRHAARVHSKEKNFKCSDCDQSFFDASDLQRHKKRKHLHAKHFVCSTCDKRFVTRYDLTAHIRIHTGEKPFKCEICSAQFANQSNLIAHRKIHQKNRKTYVCKVCDKSYTSSSALKLHRKLHLNKKRVKTNSCVFCEKAFMSNKSLETHILRHINECNFSCDVCGEEFVTGSQLGMHARKKHRQNGIRNSTRLPIPVQSAVLLIQDEHHNNDSKTKEASTMTDFKMSDCKSLKTTSTQTDFEDTFATSKIDEDLTNVGQSNGINLTELVADCQITNDDHSTALSHKTWTADDELKSGDGTTTLETEVAGLTHTKVVTVDVAIMEVKNNAIVGDEVSCADLAKAASQVNEGAKSATDDFATENNATTAFGNETGTRTILESQDLISFDDSYTMSLFNCKDGNSNEMSQKKTKALECFSLLYNYDTCTLFLPKIEPLSDEEVDLTPVKDSNIVTDELIENGSGSEDNKNDTKWSA